MNDLVSVIIPIYNVEKYIDECIESVIQQTYKNIEIILIDDGSKDKCGKICDAYMRQDKRIKVIHKENGGLSDARNKGLDVATGKYITFIDSDDYISKYYIERLLTVLKKENADIVQTDKTMQKTDFKIIGNKFECKIFSRDEALRSLWNFGDIEVYAWGKLYKKELWNMIRFPIGRINEDACTTYKVIYKSKKIAAIKDALYFYRKNEESIMGKKFYMERFDIFKVPDEIVDFLGEEEKMFEREILYYKFRVGINLINCSMESQDNSIKIKRDEIIKWIRGLSLNIYGLDFKYKLMLLGIKLCPKLYLEFVKRNS